MAQLRLIASNQEPASGPIQRETSVPLPALTDEQADRIITVLSEIGNPADVLMFRLCLRTGLRPHEAVAVTIGELCDGVILRYPPYEVRIPLDLQNKLMTYAVGRKSVTGSFPLDAPLFVADGRPVSSRVFLGNLRAAFAMTGVPYKGPQIMRNTLAPRIMRSV